MNCPYCGDEAVFLTSKEFYGKDYGSNLYVCRPCNAYVGTHGNTHHALGTMADENLRKWRKAAHSIFDPLWRGKTKEMSRTAAYGWMQDALGLRSDEAHIGMFNEAQCKQLIELVKQKRFSKGGISHE